jgi:hypothetical protein
MAEDKVTAYPRCVPMSDTAIFEDFDSLTIIDSGATDGFILEDNNGAQIVIPSGIVVNISGPNGKLGKKILVKAASGKTLNAGALVYD